MAHLLVVDDEKDGRQMLSHFLRRRGYTVAEAPDGELALRKLLDDWPDAVVLDVRMPGMSGVELLKTIRSYHRWQSLPVVLVTAHATAEEITEARDMGVEHVFEKSNFQLADFGRAIDSAVGTA